MRKFSAKITATAFSVAVMFAVSVSPLHATPKTVNCDAPGQSLQKNLDSAPEGSTVNFTGNCSDGPFNINRDVNLSGNGAGVAMLSATGGGSVLNVNSARAILSGFTVDADGENVGIGLSGGHARLFNVVIENSSSAGLFVGGGSSVHVSGSLFRNNGFSGATISSSGGSFFNSTFEQNHIGVTARESGGVTINGDSTIDDNDIGIIVATNGTAQVTDSTITNSTFDGILVVTQGVLSIFGPTNTFGNNGGVDVACDSRGIVEVGQPQIPNGGTTSIDLSCLVFGTIFDP